MYFCVPVLEQDQKKKTILGEIQFLATFFINFYQFSQLYEKNFGIVQSKSTFYLSVISAFENCASMKNRRGLHALQKNFELLYHYSMVCLLYY